MTVAELRQLLASLPDDAPVLLKCGGACLADLEGEATIAVLYHRGDALYYDVELCTPDFGEVRVPALVLR